jgi:hypothetical protein
MYINVNREHFFILMLAQNVGHCVDALFDSDGLSHDHSAALSKVQAAHVSIISLSSCVGRIAAGMSSDILIKKYGLQRTWCLVCASFVAILAQLSGWLISTLDLLVRLFCSSITLTLVCCLLFVGFWIWASLWMFSSHRFVYLSFHSLTILATELFGLEYQSHICRFAHLFNRSFSQNWGWITLTPAFSSTLFNIVYGTSRKIVI